MLSPSDPPSYEGPICPLPLKHAEQIVMGHGSGGRMTADLIRQVFMPYLDSQQLTAGPLSAGNDFGMLDLPGAAGLQGKLVISTDSHIVNPLFFPGGDIGRLSVCGTVNDLSVSGAVPLYLTAGFILEEGFPVEQLQRILQSMHSTAGEAGVLFVAGDTKVVEKGKGDGVFINTTGIGWLPPGMDIHGANAQPGDSVIISGTLGDHGIAVLSARGDLGFQSEIQSDVAPLNHLIQSLLAVVPSVHVMRDPTRGGLATTLNEIAQQSQVSIWLDETAIPVQPPVQAACEMLGFDPLYIANEGKVIIILPTQHMEKALQVLHSHPLGQLAARIGEIRETPTGHVLLKTVIGGTHFLDMLAGEILPRIC
jgi:hydrogenase expression/formation protein HypE